MPYASQRDRTPDELEISRTPWPAPPLNFMISAGIRPGQYDLVWTDPSQLAVNGRFILCGVNIYRSFDSEFGPFERVTHVPLGSTFWRDITDNVLIPDEDVTGRFIMDAQAGAAGGYAPRYVFRVEHFPIVKEGSQGELAYSPHDVIVMVDGVRVPVLNIFPRTGEIEISPYRGADIATQKLEPSTAPTPTSRVTCTYRYTRSLLRTDLAQRVFYRAVTVGLPIDCDLATVQPQDLVETPLENASSTSNAEIEKLDYMWKEAVRRNHWILQEGGERVHVFLKKHVGIPCPCIPDNYHKQARSDCHICFAPGTLVRAAQGWVPIQTIQVGDRVLASDGTFRRVRQVFATAYEGPLVQVKSSISAEPLLVTPNHPFRALRGTHKVPGKCGPKCDPYIHRGDGLTPGCADVRQLPSGRWWARAQVGGSRGHGRKALGTYASRVEAEMVVLAHKQEHLRAGHTLEWVPAGDLVRGDWLVPCWDETISNVSSVRVPSDFLKTSSYGPQRQGATEFLVDTDFLWVVGMYLAEGSTSVRTVNFALHQDEVLFQDRLRAFFHRYGYASFLIPGNGQGVSVQIHSTTLAQWLPILLGHLCYNKHIPEEWMHLPVDKTWALIQGIYDGDGWKAENEITQTSKVLALQLVELLHRVGEQPLVRQQVARKRTPKGNLRRTAYCVSWAGRDFRHANRKGRWLWRGHVLAQVRGVGQVPYKGMVYNLAVEGDETYVAEGLVVHNCYGAGIVGGYEGPYDLLVAPDDAEKRVAQKDIGRTVEHSYEIWTGPSPLLSHRDFIVKLNGDRYSIGPVRMPSNRGMVLQQHFTIGIFDEKDIRYRVPLDNPVKYAAVQFVPQGPERAAEHEVTNKPNIPQERQYEGKTPTWENIEY